MPKISNLSGHFLIAMPGLEDSYFGDSLIYLFEHNHEGAMGLVVNQPGELNLADILLQLQPEATQPHCDDIQIFLGGPVQSENGFVLHTSEQSYQHTARVGQLSLTTSRDILLAIAKQQGPESYLIALGYAGWGAGQLENEIKNNSWLTCPAEHAIVFSQEASSKHTAAINSLGINPLFLSQDAGHG